MNVWILTFLAVVISFALSIYLLGLSGQRNKNLNKYLEAISAAGSTIDKQTSLRNSAEELTYFAKIKLNFGHKLAESNIKIPVDNWIRMWFVIGLLLLGILYSIASVSVIAILLISMVITYLLQAFVIQKAKSKIENEFAEDFPDALLTIAGAIRSGLGFEQGLESIAMESNREIGIQFKQVINDISLGSSMEEALQQVANRTNNKDIEWLIEAVNISRTTGSSMTQILDSIANSIHSKAQLRREIKSLTAEGMLSAYVVAGLPVAIFSFLFLTRTEYVSVFWTTSLGIGIAISAISAITIGWFWTKSLVKIKGI